MASIPVGEAAFEGFRVVARNPLAVLMWGLALFVLAVLPFLGAFSLLASSFGDLLRQAAEDAEPSFEEAMRLQFQMMALNPLLMIPSLISRVVLTCAIFRAVLRPEDNRFFYLRLSVTELLVGAVFLALMMVFFALFFAAILLGVGVTLTTWAVSEAAGVGVAIILVVGLLGGVIWLALRLSMAMPMTFAERRFRFFESWELTRGHVLSLLLLGLLTVVIVWLLEMVLVMLFFAAVLPFAAGGAFNEGAITAFFSRPMGEWMADLAPWLLIGGLVFSVIGAVFYTVITAPWAAAYRALATPAADAAQSPA